MKKKTIIGVLVLLLFSAALAFAEDGGFSAAQYTDAAKGDIATKMLGFVFGDVKGYFEGTNTHIAKMFMVFNSAVAAVSVLMLMFNIMGATIQTAHEGEVLGRRYSTIWMPIRNVFGLAGVFPILGGWSIGQAFMFLAALVGIGVGTLTWQAAISGMLETTISAGLLASEEFKEEAPYALIRAQMCALGFNDERRRGGETLEDVAPIIMVHAAEYTNRASRDNPWGNFSGSYIVYGADPARSILPHGIAMDFCGGVRVSAPGTPSAPVDSPSGQLATVRSSLPFKQPVPSPVAIDFKAIAKARFQALMAMDAQLQPISRNFYENNQRPSNDQLQEIGKQYKVRVNEAVAAEGRRIASSFQSSLGPEGQSWIWAGAIFNKISATQRQLVAAADEPLEGVAPRWNPNEGAFDNIKALAQTALSKFNIFKKEKSPSFDPESSDVTSGITKSMFSPTLEKTIQLMTRGEIDLMVGLSNLGSTIVTAGIVSLVAVKGMLLSGSLAGTKILGTGVDLTALLNFIGNLSLLILVPLFFAGLVFAYYVPFIPMIIWYGGVLSWFIIVCEAVVAAPLWMLAHMEAEGEGMGQKTAHGYMFLLNLFFRPAIMVIGLVLGWVVVNIFGFLLAYMLSLFFGSQDQYHSPTGLFMFIACLVVFASLSMFTVNKAFSLIHVLPDQVFAFVGGHMKGFGGDEAQDAHTNIVGVARFGQHKADMASSGAGANPMVDMANELKEIRKSLGRGGDGRSGE